MERPDQFITWGTDESFKSFLENRYSVGDDLKEDGSAFQSFGAAEKILLSAAD